jgi:AcrR family transcriptional regulator
VVRKSARDNQRHRTRKDVLAAAARLLKDGGSPSMDDVAEAAMVSRATAYRYFPSLDALLVEAPLDGAVPSPEALFADDRSSDAEARIDKAEAALHEMVYRNEAQLRRMLAHSLGVAGRDEDAVPIRQNRRTPLIAAALAPAKGRLKKAAYERLCAALAVFFGTESMVVFRDVLQLDAAEARKVKSWAMRALVRAALRESSARV